MRASRDAGRTDLLVTEHIETLHEINIEARDEAKKVGIERFRMMQRGRLSLFIVHEGTGLQAIGMELLFRSARSAEFTRSAIFEKLAHAAGSPAKV